MAEEVQVVPWVLHGLVELFWTMIHCPFSWQKINFPVLERNMYIHLYICICIYTFILINVSLHGKRANLSENSSNFMKVKIISTGGKATSQNEDF